MAHQLFIPQLGQTVEEVTLLEWVVEDGAQVKKGQEILEVETDKAVFDVEATADGFVHFGPYKSGDVVPVLTVVAVIGEKEDEFSAPEPAAHKVDSAPPSEAPPVVERDKTGPSPDLPLKSTAHEHLKASPRAKKLAAQLGVDLSAVQATGGGGLRVTEADVRRYAGSPAGPQVGERIPLRGIRKVTAERMAASAAQTARVTLFIDVGAAQLVKLRERLVKEHTKGWGFKPGYNDLLVGYCAKALKEFPYMNARLREGAIEHLAGVNIGVAVDDERGLFVPVIKGADRKDTRTIGTELRAAVEAIRAGKATGELLAGGTFTITNLGAYGIDGFTPVINLPETAILGVGRIAEKPVAVDGKVAVRPMLTLSLVFDHRLVDGAPAARFLAGLKHLIETAH